MIFVDNFEPDTLEALIQQSVDTIRDSFNAKGLPDYTWIAIDGHRIGVSRKQAGELLASIDNTELQLRKDMAGVDALYLLVEGYFSPILSQMATDYMAEPPTEPLHITEPPTSYFPHNIVCWVPSKDGRFFREGHKYNVSFSMVQGWFEGLRQAGIAIIQTAEWRTTAMALVELYHFYQKKEHTTLQRYIKTKIYPKPFNPHVETLMGIRGVNLGEKRAKALIEEFGTVWMVLLQEPKDLAKVEGIGPITAKRLLEAIGRTI